MMICKRSWFLAGISYYLGRFARPVVLSEPWSGIRSLFEFARLAGITPQVEWRGPVQTTGGGTGNVGCFGHALHAQQKVLRASETHTY